MQDFEIGIFFRLLNRMQETRVIIGSIRDGKVDCYCHLQSPPCTKVVANVELVLDFEIFKDHGCELPSLSLFQVLELCLSKREFHTVDFLKFLI